jgi:MoaA/NifB/PqqE/SkfB family radical SAM enzyme
MFNRLISRDSLSTLEGLFIQGVGLQRGGVFKKARRLRRLGWHAARSFFKRCINRVTKGLSVPVVITLSPTMRCNLDCDGCYSRDYPREQELSIAEIDRILASAEGMGVFLFIISGGEPLMVDGLLDVMSRHRRLLYLLVTNGTLLDRNAARKIAEAGNIIPAVSLEGGRDDTDRRRGEGVYDAVERAMKWLKAEGVLFGFSVTVTRLNLEAISSDRFIDDMLARGCTLGFCTEYIPVGSGARPDFVLDDGERHRLRRRVVEIRRHRRIVLAHLPDDEYTADGRCMAVAGGCFHINSQGCVEPCPFAHFASDNVRDKSLEEIFRSEFLRRLRHSDAVFRKGRVGCTLLENMETVEAIAAETGARRTDAS